jgi:hypothetical protein
MLTVVVPAGTLTCWVRNPTLLTSNTTLAPVTFKEKLPVAEVTVAFLVPFCKTVALGIGALFASVTVPVMVLSCAIAKDPQSTKKTDKICLSFDIRSFWLKD